MGQVSVHIGGHSYSVACNDGDEERVSRLAAYIDRKADDLTGAIGQMSETRLLLMAGLMIADELFELKEGGVPRPAAAEPGLSFEELAARIEALADGLERAPA